MSMVKGRSLLRRSLEAVPQTCLVLFTPCCPIIPCLLCYVGMSPLKILKRAGVSLLINLIWVLLFMLDTLLCAVYRPILRFWHGRCKDAEPAEAVEFGTEVLARGRKTVVIVGGSFGGLAALRHFSWHDPSFRVILVDQREFFEYTPGVLRLFCDPNLFWEMARPSPQGTHEFLLGSVSCVNSDHIMVLSGGGGRSQRVDFDYLILSTGADFNRPITPSSLEVTMASRATSWQKEAAKVCSASSVIVLGGGAVGVELAAEIVCHFPDKQVTIVDAAPGLLPLFPSTVANHAQRWFEERGVELVLGEALEKWDDISCTTKSGRVISAGAVYVCFGSRCNTQCIAGGSMATCLGPRKEVRVNEYLQVDEWPHVFAVGDVMAHPAKEIKQAYYAEMNGKAAAMNVIHHSRQEKLAKYPDALAGASISPFVYVVSLGRYDGSLGFNGIVVNGVIAAVMKWILEWTKIREMEGRPIGLLFWHMADEVTFFLSRRLIKPPGSQ